MTWSPLLASLQSIAEFEMNKYFFAAFDFRGHGRTRNRAALEEGGNGQGAADEENLDLSAEQLVRDTLHAIDAMQARRTAPTRVILVGHSMGGAIATRVASHDTSGNVQGVVVLDVVEGTAIASLDYVRSVLEKRPKEFVHPEDAVRWCVETRLINNFKSAKETVPSMLQSAGSVWKWRTKLSPTWRHWAGWYKGMSRLFADLGTTAAPIRKLLILAGRDRLDTTLTIAQMEGKFMLGLIPDAGHAVHEDRPKATAEKVAQFLKIFFPN